MTPDEAVQALMAAIERENDMLDWIETQRKASSVPVDGRYARIDNLTVGAIRALRGVRLAVVEDEAS